MDEKVPVKGGNRICANENIEIPNLLVTGVKEAFSKSHAKIINFMNLVTKSGQTTDYKASDHIKDLEMYLGKKIDIIFVNTGNIREDILEHYKEHDEKVVQDDLPKSDTIIRMDLVADIRYNASKADKHPRSILRHDPNKVAVGIKQIT